MPYFEAIKVFNEIVEEIDSFDLPVQKRLWMIEKNWEKFTTFYFVKNAPANSNPLKNYYSTSLKTHRKKQLRTDRGIQDHMKPENLRFSGPPTMKRAGLLDKHKKTLIETFIEFTHFIESG